MSLDRRATRWRGASGRTQADVIGIEVCAVMLHRPQAARHLVGQCNRGLVVTDALLQLDSPSLEAGKRLCVLPAKLSRAQGSARAVDEQQAQVAITALADAAESPL